MLTSVKAGLLLVAGLTGAAVSRPPSDGGVRADRAQSAPTATQLPDTATVRLHISGMTCGSCPATARLALNRLPGVYGATVTLDDSLGVVRYDPSVVTPTQIAAHLTRVTGYRTTILQDSAKGSRAPGEG